MIARRLLLLAAIALPACDHRAVHSLHDGVLRVAIVGDSVAHGAGDESGRGIAGNLDALLREAHDIRNLGIDGARTWNVLNLLRKHSARATLAACDAVVISIGGNDLYGDSVARLSTLLAPSLAMDRVIGRVGAIVAKIHGLNPGTRVVLLGLYDPYRTPFLDEQVAHWDARLIERFAADRTVDVVRIADVVRLSPADHFHPGAAGYAAIAARIAPALPTASCNRDRPCRRGGDVRRGPRAAASCR